MRMYVYFPYEIRLKFQESRPGDVKRICEDIPYQMSYLKASGFGPRDLNNNCQDIDY